MRDIKFRVYDTVNKCFIEDMTNFWITPDFKGLGGLQNGIGFIADDLQPDGPFVFQQYTGLKDKNGVEIYEGDYVLYPHKSGPFIVGLELSEEKTNWVQCEVKWKAGGLAAYWGHNDCNIVTFNFKQFIVVGNIFEGVDE